MIRGNFPPQIKIQLILSIFQTIQKLINWIDNNIIIILIKFQNDSINSFKWGWLIVHNSLPTILMSFWCHFGVIFVTFWCHFWFMIFIDLMAIFSHFGVLLMSFWCHFGVIFVTFWCHIYRRWFPSIWKIWQRILIITMSYYRVPSIGLIWN